MDSAGNLYGTTLYGGNNGTFGNPGEGTVFRVIPAGKESVLYKFTGDNDGGLPFAGVIINTKARALYGTSTYGGNGACENFFGAGCGTVYKLTAQGESVIYSFQAGTDGSYPEQPLIQDSAGNLYGNTAAGGGNACSFNPSGCGAVFKVDATGKETILHAFTGGADGAAPSTPLVADAAGNLYGGTSFGGDLDCQAPNGCGTIFEISKAGGFTVLHTFTGSEGSNPNALLLGKSGDLIGSASQVVNGIGNSVIFKLTP